MKSLLITALVSIAIYLNSAQLLAQQWSEEIEVAKLSSSRLHLSATLTIPGTCVDNAFAYLDPNESNHGQVMSLLLAAMMADKTVRLECSDSCASVSRCRVLDAEIIN